MGSQYPRAALREGLGDNCTERQSPGVRGNPEQKEPSPGLHTTLPSLGPIPSPSSQGFPGNIPLVTCTWKQQENNLCIGFQAS